MALGLDVTKAQVDRIAGAVAQRLNESFDFIREFKEWLDTKTVGDLEALGYTTAEANTLKSAWADAGQLADIFLGTASLATAKDFRTFLRQVWGLGLLENPKLQLSLRG